MTSKKPTVVVLGADSMNDVPGMQSLAGLAEFRYARGLDALKSALPGADVLFGWDFREATLLDAWDQAGDLKWIQWPGAGVDSVLFPQLVDSDIVLTNMRGLFDRAMAEFTLGQILMFAKQFDVSLSDQRERQWNHRLTEVIRDRSVLIVGVGSIGREIARLLKSVGMQVSGVGRTARTGDVDFGDIGAVTNLNDLLVDADYVVLITPLTADTRELFGETEFKSMSSSARFINLGRGALVVEPDLVDALHSGEIAGAALDVFVEEPLPADSKLWDAPNCLISPHMSGDFVGFESAVTGLFGDNLKRYIGGQELRNVVDKSAGFVSE